MIKTYRKKQFISDLKEGDFVDDVYVVKIKKGISPYTKGYYFDLLLSDNTGKNLDYKYWGSQDEEKIKLLYSSINQDSIVHVQGKISVYNGKLQLTTNEPFFIETLSPEQYDLQDFIKPNKQDIEKMYSSLLRSISLVQNQNLKSLLEKIFNDEDVAKKFKLHPASIEIHHNWISGLLQHTLEVLNYCMSSANMFPELNKDLLITGALLHDIGKLEELVVTSRIKGSLKGQLVGHLALGLIYVSNKIDEIDEFNEDLKNKVLHMITSHHGKNEYGSPKEPMFPEAIALYYADEMSSKIAEIIEFIEISKDDTEDDFIYNRRHKKNILLNNKKY